MPVPVACTPVRLWLFLHEIGLEERTFAPLDDPNAFVLDVAARGQATQLAAMLFDLDLVAAADVPIADTAAALAALFDHPGGLRGRVDATLSYR